MSCIESGFVDKKGRIWLNPCESAAEGFRFSFFQFDGNKSIFYDFQPPWLDKADRPYVWKLLGETPNGILYGVNYDFYNTRKVFFTWNPETNQSDFYRLQSDELFHGSITTDSGKTFVLTSKNAEYRFITKVNNQPELFASLDVDPIITKEYYDPLQIILHDDNAIFLHQTEGLIKTDLNEGKMELLSWDEISNSINIKIDPYAYCCYSQSWKITLAPNGEILLYLGPLNGFFTLNPETFELAPFEELNEKTSLDKNDGSYMRVELKKDRHNNLLILSSSIQLAGFPIYDHHNLQAMVWSNSGSWLSLKESISQHKTSLTFSALDYSNKFFSSNYKTELAWTTEEGFMMIDLQPNLGIQNHRIKVPSRIGIRSMAPVGPHKLLVNTDLEILQIFDLEKGTFKYLNDDVTIAWPLSKIVSKDDHYFVSLRGNKLLSYNINTNKYEQTELGITFEKFEFIDDERLLIATVNGYLMSFNINTHSLSAIKQSGSNLKVSADVTDINVVDDVAWISTLSGLWQLNLKTLQLKNMQEDHPLLGESVVAIYPDSKNELWLGTSKHGLLIFNPDTKKIKQVTHLNGLASNTVVGILPDDKGNKWVATYNGISVINAEGRVLFGLGAEDGLTDNEFNRTSFAKLPDGRLAFGGIDGLNILDPSYILEILSVDNQQNIYLTGLEYFDQDAGTEKLFTIGETLSSPIQIPPEHKYITLDFALSTYLNTSKHRYAYRLIPSTEPGADNNYDNITWIDIGSHSEVTINNLPSGNYTIQIKGADPHSFQSITPLELEISVGEFFYKQWWFYVLMSIPVVLVVAAWVRRNLTEKKRLQFEVERRTARIINDKAIIEEQASQLKELDLAKSRFFTNISHEFRTPLTIILGMTEKIKGDNKAKTLIKRNSKIILNLINQILDLKKLESGKLTAKYVQGDLVVYFRYLMASYRSMAEDKQISLTYESNQEELLADYDPEKLRHIVSNLIANSIKYTPAGGEISLYLISSSDPGIPSYEFAVTDTGMGIPADKLPHIFDRFYQVDDEISRTGSGTGIGLSLVRELVVLMGGEIHAESRPGSGTKFIVRMPHTTKAEIEIQDYLIKTLSSDPHGEIDIQEEHIAANKDLPKLLITEDSKDVREFISITLNGFYQIITARDGLEGLNKAINEVPDIIISDVMMPGMDGLTLCQKLKTDQRTSHIPIILLTAKADLESKLSGISKGADAYLTKPFDKRELYAQLQNLLKVRQKLQQRYSHLEDPEPSSESEFELEDQFIIKAKQTVKEHMLDEGFGVTSLCTELGMSRTQVHNKIKSLTNKSTSHFIKAVRLNRAKELLSHSEFNISQVASEVGIDSLPYFSKIFTEETGMSPTEYRETVTGNL